MKKHTPGPWHSDQYGEQIHAGTYSHGTSRHIANVFTPTPKGPIGGAVYSASAYKEERLANARLIAAAPDLLIALETLWGALTTKECQRIEEQVGPVCATVMKVLAKARGES